MIRAWKGKVIILSLKVKCFISNDIYPQELATDVLEFMMMQGSQVSNPFLEMLLVLIHS